MKYVYPLVVLALLTGCKANQQRDTIISQFNNTIPTCSSDKECEVKWSAARRWVLQNAAMKLQHVEDDYLETYSPRANSPKLAARVIKEPTSSGNSYRILVSTWCANLFGCVPDKWESALDFNQTVNRSYSGATAKKKKVVKDEVKDDRKYGDQSMVAERYAKSLGCTDKSGATAIGNLITEKYGAETYLFNCSDGDQLIRCDLNVCEKI